MTYDYLKTLYNDLMYLVTGIVVKRTDLAKNAETAETARAWDQYFASVTGRYSFHTFNRYAESVLAKHYSDPNFIYACVRNPANIPSEDRESIAKDQAAYVIENFVERNNYYRILMGLPPTSATTADYIYITDQPTIPSDTPIHELTADQISRLEVNGTLAKLQKRYPNRDYLKYLGNNAIDLTKARLARRFDILRLGVSSSEETKRNFLKEYMMARRYVLVSSYNSDLVSDKTLYDPIMGTIILTLAIRNTLVPDEKAYLDYDEILDAILESYGLLKYFGNFPHTYKRRLVIALDNLLMYKGTDGVLIDVCKIFSPDDLIANRYYILKYPTVDVYGHVSFTNNPKTDFTMDFVKAPIKDHDINYAEEHRVPYESVTESDYLWQLTKAETESLRRGEFNLMMSKYIDAEAAFDVTGLVFETCCFLNLLTYARYNLDKVYLYNQYATNGRCTVFSTLMFLFAAMAKRSGYDGNIIYDPIDIGELWSHYRLDSYKDDNTGVKVIGKTEDDGRHWRFNYGVDMDLVQEIVDKYELRIDVVGTILDEYETIQLTKPSGNCTASDMVNIYVTNRALYEAILEEMATTMDIGRYEGLARLRDILFTSTEQYDTFEMADGTHAATYYDMLVDMEPKLAAKLDSCGNEIGIDGTLTDKAESELNNLIVYALEQLENLFTTDEFHYLFLGTPSVYTTLLGKYIRTAINVFKASSVQFRNINIVLKLGDRDPIRLIDDQRRAKVMYPETHVHVIDECSVHRTIYIDDMIYVGDKIYTNM